MIGKQTAEDAAKRKAIPKFYRRTTLIASSQSTLMAIQFIPILKALAPLIAEAGATALKISGLRKSQSELREHESLEELEQRVLRIGKVTVELAQQTQAAVEQQAAANAAFERKIRLGLAVSVSALCLAAIALVVAVRG